MASGAILRRKFISDPLKFSISAPPYILRGLNLGHPVPSTQLLESRAFTTWPHIHSIINTSQLMVNREPFTLGGLSKTSYYNINVSSGHGHGNPDFVRYFFTSTPADDERFSKTLAVEALSSQGKQNVHTIWSRYYWATKKRKWKIAFYTILSQFTLGQELLRRDVKITQRLLLKVFRGKILTRKERQLLTMTTADLFRRFPRIMFMIVPFIEFLLPTFLKLFPNISPSAFQAKMKKQEQARRKLVAKIEYAKFLQDTSRVMAKEAQNMQNGDIQPTGEDFIEFRLSTLLRGKRSSREEIFGYAKLFTDELILDNISRPLLVNMCEDMGITPFGTDDYLRFVLWETLGSIKEDDKLIQAKGVESLTEADLHKACRARGIHVAEDMSQQLCDWLDLSLNHSLPSSLLMLSRASTVTGNSKPEEAVSATLISLPYELNYTLVSSIPWKDTRIGKIIKLESLDVQEKLIKEEELSKREQSNPNQDDVGLKEMTLLMSEQAQAIAVHKQEKLPELISDAIAVLACTLNVSTECSKIMRLVNKEMNLYNGVQDIKGLDGEKEALKAFKAAPEENDKDAKLNTGDKVSSELINRADGMLQNLEKEMDDFDVNIGRPWRVLERYCDGKVGLDMVAAAAFLMNTLDKEGIQELITSLSKYKEEIVKLKIGAEDINQQNQLAGSRPPMD
ncbi:Mitochondrial proton/calcium exchanger protein [Heracleum sosnowskyi]|uniref:Mitochondrial proton/calcium exchanger protein n=1 Tax=Heracleum sosnowskyi TaxID=360622 RepID=A0AAD8HJ90_9APIA|nr:Mitochondrial proton/calcium exchanger protein [Heracleum sosnowskyi]